MVAGHIHLVGVHIGKSAALDIHDAPETRAGRQAVFVLAGDFAGAAANAIRVVVDEAKLLDRLHRVVGLGHLALESNLDFFHV